MKVSMKSSPVGLSTGIIMKASMMMASTIEIMSTVMAINFMGDISLSSVGCFEVMGS